MCQDESVSIVLNNWASVGRGTSSVCKESVFSSAAASVGKGGDSMLLYVHLNHEAY